MIKKQTVRDTVTAMPVTMEIQIGEAHANLLIHANGTMLERRVATASDVFSAAMQLYAFGDLEAFAELVSPSASGAGERRAA